jgi:hypothetical protein
VPIRQKIHPSARSKKSGVNFSSRALAQATTMTRKAAATSTSNR